MRGSSCQLALNNKNPNFEDVSSLIDSGICDIIATPVSARSGSPQQCSTFSIMKLMSKNTKAT